MCIQSLSCIRLFVIPWNCSLPGSSVHGIFQARILVCVCVCVKSLQLCPTFCDPKTVVLGDSPSEKTEEYWSGLLFPSPGDLPDLGIEPASPALAGRFFTSEPPGKPLQRKTWYLAKSD